MKQPLSMSPGQVSPFRSRSRALAGSAALAVTALSSADTAGAQAVGKVVLTTAADSLSRRFSAISNIYELPSGRVILIDSRERIIAAGDFRDGVATQLGRHGSGPGEYLLPSRVFRLPGDSAAVLDRAHSRVVLVSPVGTIVGTRTAILAGPDPSARPISRPPLAFVDSAGFLYGQAPPIDRSQRPPRLTDSAAVERWGGAGDRSDTIGLVGLDSDPSRAVLAVAGGVVVSRPTSPNPYPAVDQWTVCWDGRVAIVRVQPYRVEYQLPSGDRVTGPPVAYSPVRVTNELKELWRRERRQPRSAIVHADAASPPQVIEVNEPVREPASWPEFLPPFLRDAVSCSLEGVIWVKRATAANQRPLFDVFDARGTLATQVQLPPRSRVVGFGRSHLYLARVNEDGEEILLRYALRGVTR